MKSEQRQPRNLEIDTIRGFACILLVAYHVIGSESTNGLLVADGPYRIIADLLAFIRMPLFTFLSGYVYAWHPYRGAMDRGAAGAFIRGKARRLLIPMLVVGSFFVLIRSWTPGTNLTSEPWVLLHLLPVEHFWFVESLFLIFLLIIPLEAGGMLKTERRFFAIFILVALAFVSQVEFPTNYFSINGVFYLLPFFLAGLASSRFDLRTEKRYSLLWIGLLLPYAYLAIRIQSPDWMLERRSLIALWIGLLSSFLLVRSEWQQHWLARIGHFSYSIYLFHVFFTAASRIFLQKLHLTSMPIFVIAGVIAGVWGPILLDLIVSTHWLSGTLLLGKKVRLRENRDYRYKAPPAIETVTLPSQSVAE